MFSPGNEDDIYRVDNRLLPGVSKDQLLRHTISVGITVCLVFRNANIAWVPSKALVRMKRPTRR